VLFFQFTYHGQSLGLHINEFHLDIWKLPLTWLCSPELYAHKYLQVCEKMSFTFNESYTAFIILICPHPYLERCLPHECYCGQDVGRELHWVTVVLCRRPAKGLLSALEHSVGH